MDLVQALGVTLHKPSKKIHYVLGGGGEGRLVLRGALGENEGLGWVDPSTTLTINQPTSLENVTG